MQAETDFLKQRNNDKGFIPDDIADKDFHQLVYWAQQISTP